MDATFNSRFFCKTKKTKKVIFNRMKLIVIELRLFSNLFNPNSDARCVFL